MRFAPLAPNKEDERRRRQKASDGFQSGQSIIGGAQGKVIGLKKSSNLKTSLRKEAVDEKIFTVAWRAHGVSSFMRRATRTFERKRHLICFLLVQLGGTRACRSALRAHDVNCSEKGGS